MSDESYYNTTRVRGHQLRLYEFQAERQEHKVREFMEANPTFEPTAEDIGRLVLPGTPRTSWGRCLTNLKKQGIIAKTDKQLEGQWGRPIYLWRLIQAEPAQEEMF